jgi:outer membrane lipoprotein-sorting protein
VTRARPWFVLVPLLLACITSAADTQPTTTPATADSALWSQLNDIDARAGRIKSLSANFEQQKFTAMLRKPLTSTGNVRVRGAQMQWQTVQPEPSVLAIDEHHAQVYYPSQKTLEVYPLDERLGELAASPLPRLAVLKARFSFARIPPDLLDKQADSHKVIALELTPTDASLREHVKRVRVLLDVAGAYILKAEVTDSDGDRTLLSFRDVQPDADVGDLSLHVPPGTAVTHPLEGLDGPRQSQGPSK